MNDTPPILALMGPTGSGKSALALSVAEYAKKRAIDITIINCDSSQVYRELRTLTARPSEADESRFEHRLYGFLSAAEPCSAGLWLAHAVRAIGECHASGKVPFLVGGTGLYLRCLTEGIADIPPIPESASQLVDNLWKEHGTNGLYAELMKRDPLIKNRIDGQNSRRVMRAFEVWEATGKSLVTWQENTPPGPYHTEQIALHSLQPNREWLYKKINARVLTMVKTGALEEVKALTKLQMDPTLPAMRALGVRAFSQHLGGDLSLEAAIERTQQETRRYAKRQYTWMRHQMADGIALDPSEQSIEEMTECIASCVD